MEIQASAFFTEMRMWPTRLEREEVEGRLVRLFAGTAPQLCSCLWQSKVISDNGAAVGKE